MDPYQKQLTDPSQYRVPVDRAEVMKEIEAGASGVRDHETMSFMKRAVNEVNEGGDLTIAHAASSYESMRRATRSAPDRSLAEFGVLAACGDAALTNYLIRRANLLAQGIKPGAQQVMADAFGK